MDMTRIVVLTLGPLSLPIEFIEQHRARGSGEVQLFITFDDA